jgi:ribosomal protein L7/L12
MALTISISGTAEEIIAYGKVLEKGMRPRRVPSKKKTLLKLEHEYLEIIVGSGSGLINAIKECRSKTGMLLKDAKDYIEALIGRAMQDGRLIRSSGCIYTYERGPSFKS